MSVGHICPGSKAALKHAQSKRWRDGRMSFEYREASWTAPALWRF